VKNVFLAAALLAVPVIAVAAAPTIQQPTTQVQGAALSSAAAGTWWVFHVQPGSAEAPVGLAMPAPAASFPDFGIDSPGPDNTNP
jgi:hypothetical protein